ncbi:MAG: endonuclease YncB(thermonuclease family) [Bacteroidia bacterium]|jgi:endonuclease YncB( thermonuclease family)
MLSKTPRRFRLGVFVCLPLAAFCCSISAHASTELSCKSEGALERASLAHVVDGDTLRLSDGRMVRLIGVNTPELGRDGLPDQPLADRARRTATDWLAGADIFLQVEAKDHYGRVLASVFRGSDRLQLGEYLLRQGLAWQVTVPPNSLYSDCLQTAEREARAVGRGVWAPQRYPVLSAASLAVSDAGFQRLRGRVSKLTDSPRALWIELDGALSLRLGKSDRAYFKGMNFKELTGKVLTLRGWLIYRGKQQRGYPPHMMHLQHPAMLEAIEE